jgi:formate hydrogenlyase subunit 3/multisubunit Na+/H+ antiporter MnhD subunit
LKTVILFINLHFISFFNFLKLNNFEKKIFKIIYLIYSIISLLFSKKLPLLFKSKHKKRIYKIFKFFKRKKKFFKLKSLNNYRLFINNIKIVNFFMRKCVSKYRRESRKEYYKKLKEKNNRMKTRLKLLKKIFKRSSIQKTMKKF